MSKKATRGVLSPATLPLGTENELNFLLFIFYCYFGAHNQVFSQVLAHIFCPCIFIPGPMVSAGGPSPTGSPAAPVHPAHPSPEAAGNPHVPL